MEMKSSAARVKLRSKPNWRMFIIESGLSQNSAEFRIGSYGPGRYERLRRTSNRSRSLSGVTRTSHELVAMSANDRY